ncbi:hypothetical protein CEUSTIGMA_g5632.t1 [Chlamydomonas eustigma]|uniref:RING-type domain-containing protein n=1 Tax=Chlamydomonas eustigma TaxID=1157962 RepID=A0A250X604_9CHLO|nr:hypothetical protein CEUSTIGMA_g5632.t1 [Chlamydomonas eustigma]|eukprot:GAX78190.1 hypothetical protein CEUSTIGMA_g5632.t1 [Chlamydomonas eustigma]
MGNLTSCCSGYSPEADILITSVKTGDLPRVKYVLSRNPELLNCRRGLSKDTSVWHSAVKTGKLSILSFLVEFAKMEGMLPGSAAERAAQLKLQLDVQNGRGYTPLMIAAKKGYVDIAIYLVKLGVDTFSGDRQYGLTAIHLAARGGHAQCIHAILNNAAPEQSIRSRTKLQDLTNEAGLSPLHYAVAFHHISCIEALLQHGVYLMPRSRAFTTEMDMNLSNGSTPLHIAAERNDLESARTILRHVAARMSQDVRMVADVRWVRDSDGWTPYQVARTKGQSAILVELLHPGTDLIGSFDIQDLVTPASGVAKLSVIAAAALQIKLISDLHRASEGTLLSRPGSLMADNSQEDKEAAAAARVRPTAPSRFLVMAMADASEGARGNYELQLCDSALSTDAVQAASKLRNCSSKEVQDERERGSAGPPRPASAAGRAQTPGYSYAIAAAPTVSQTASGCPGSSAATAAAATAAAATAAPALLRAPSRGNLTSPKGTRVLIDKDSILLTGMTSLQSQQSPISLWMEIDENDRVCAVCLDRQPDVGIGGCEHRLCSTCAQEMCSRVTDKPLACPFCRKCIGTFISIVDNTLEGKAPCQVAEILRMFQECRRSRRASLLT